MKSRVRTYDKPAVSSTYIMCARWIFLLARIRLCESIHRQNYHIEHKLEFRGREFYITPIKSVYERRHSVSTLRGSLPVNYRVTETRVHREYYEKYLSLSFCRIRVIEYTCSLWRDRLHSRL